MHFDHRVHPLMICSFQYHDPCPIPLLKKGFQNNGFFLKDLEMENKSVNCHFHVDFQTILNVILMCLLDQDIDKK